MSDYFLICWNGTFSFQDIELVTQALNTSTEVVKSNYLNYSDDWARNRFKVLGYDKKRLPNFQ